MRRNLLLLAALFCPAAPALAARPASVYYFDHAYRLTLGLADTLQYVADSSSAPFRLEGTSTEISYTNGSTFLLSGPEGLGRADLERTTSYALLEETEVLDGQSSLLLPPPALAGALETALEEAQSGLYRLARRPAQVLEGRTRDGRVFRALQLTGRAPNRAWEPTLVTSYSVSTGPQAGTIFAVSVPMGLNGLNRRVAEAAADKRSAVLLSLGAGGRLSREIMKVSPDRVIAYIKATGADLVSPAPADLRSLWDWQRSGTLSVSTGLPVFFCTNLKVSDPALAQLVRPYAVKEVSGRRIGFLSLVSRRQAADAELAGAPFEVTDPADKRALREAVSALRGRERAQAVVAVAESEDMAELAPLLTAAGVDVLIGPKTWDLGSGRKSLVELADWDREAHTGPALMVFPDASGAGSIRLEFGQRGELTALEGLPAPADDREPLLFHEQLAMKNAIVTHFLGSGDALLPDLRPLGKDYTIPLFHNLAAALLRGAFGAEFAAVKVRAFTSGVAGDTPTSMARSWLGSDEPVGLYLVPGSFLQALQRKAVPDRDGAAASDYQGAGYLALSGTDNTGRLGGISISAAETYTAALPASLAALEKNARPLAPPTGAPATLHGAVIGGLEALRAASPDRRDWEAGVMEAAANRSAPRSVWRLNLRRLSAQMTNVAVGGPSGYAQTGESRLSATDQTQMQGSLRLFSELLSEKFRFDAGISADYGKTVLRPRDAERVTTESVDQLVYSGELVYRMRNYNGRLGKLVIGPYASAAYDTEFSRAPGLPLRKVLRGGAGFKLFEGAVLQDLHAGLTTEQVYTNAPARTKQALEAGFRLSAPLPGTALQLSADGNYRRFARSRFDTAADLLDRLALNLRLSTRLYGDIMVSPFVSYFRATGKKLSGEGANFTAGFALEYSRLFKLKRQ